MTRDLLKATLPTELQSRGLALHSFSHGNNNKEQCYPLLKAINHSLTMKLYLFFHRWPMNWANSRCRPSATPSTSLTKTATASSPAGSWEKSWRPLGGTRPTLNWLEHSFCDDPGRKLVATSHQCYTRFTGLYLQVCKNRPTFKINYSPTCCQIQYADACFHF